MNETNKNTDLPDRSRKEGEQTFEGEINRSRRAFFAFCGGALAATVLTMRSQDELDEFQRQLEEECIRETNNEDSELLCDGYDDRLVTNLAQATEGWETEKKLFKKGLEKDTASIVSYLRTCVESVIEYFVTKKSGNLIRAHEERAYRETYFDDFGSPNREHIPDFDDYRIRLGNQTDFEPIKKAVGELPLTLLATIAAPLIEEYLFRLAFQEIHVPSTDTSMAWNVGIPSTALFALAHNFQFDMGASGLNLKFVYAVPVPQAIFGAYAWYALRREGGGIGHSIVAHSVHNIMCTLDEYYSGK